MSQESFWIMRTFNPLFFTCFAFFIALLVIVSLILKKRKRKDAADRSDRRLSRHVRRLLHL